MFNKKKKKKKKKIKIGEFIDFKVCD